MQTIFSRTTVLIYFVGVLGTFLIMAAFVGLLWRQVKPAPVNQARVEERRKAAADAGLARLQLEKFALIDATKGLYQLRIDHAMDMVIRESHNAMALRADILARVEKFNAPPPKAPEVPSEFE